MIATIRARYAEIEREVPSYRTVRRDVMDESLEGGYLDAYYRGAELRKITVMHYGETGSASTEYYFWGERLFFVYRQDHTYDEPLSGRIARTETDRLYFEDDGRLVRWLRDGRAAAVTSPEAAEMARDAHDAVHRYAQLAAAPAI